MKKIKGYKDYRDQIFDGTIEKDPYLIMKKKYGKQYEEYRQKWKEADNKKTILKFPLHVDIDLQDSCNFRCSICHQRYRKRTNRKTNFKVLKRIIDKGYKEGLKSINFGASGEPLLQKELLIEAISYAHKKGIMDLFLHTNGSLLTKETSERLIKSGLTHLCISIDAVNKRTFEKVRNSSLYKKVVNNLLKFIKIKNEKNSEIPIIRISFVINNFNYKERKRFLQIWKDKVDLIEFQNYNNRGGNLDIDKDLFIKKGFDCSTPFKRIMIWPNGDVSLCCGFRDKEVLLGNIKTKTIKELWNGKKMEKIRKSFKTRKGLPKSCVKCMSFLYELKKTEEDIK